jgi:MFS family permease
MAVATVMPVAVAQLHGLGLYAWAFSAFMAASLVGSVVAGERADAHGPGWPFVAGIGCFFVGLVIAGSAPDMPVFIVGRAVQGLGAGAVLVAIYVVIARAIPEPGRPRAFSIMSTAWVMPSVVGPLVAGFVAEHVGWRWAFLGLLPLVPLACLPLVPSLRSVGFRKQVGLRRPDDVPAPTRTWPVLRVAAGVVLLLLAGQLLNWVSLLPLAAGLVLLVPVISKLFPPGTLRLSRGLPTTVAMRGLLSGAFFATEAFIPLELTQHRGLSPTLAGLTLTGAALGWAAGSWFQGRPNLSVPRPTLVRSGAAILALGVAGIALSLWDVFVPHVAGVAWGVAGLGMGVAMASISVLVLQQSPKEQQGVNSAAVQISDTLGSALGIGLGGVVLATGLAWGFSLVWPVLIIDICMLGVAACATLVAPRMRTA